MVHITTLKALKDLLALDPEHYCVHWGFPWPEVEEDPKAIQNLNLEPMKGPWDDDEQDEFPTLYPDYATVGFSDKPKSDIDDVNDIGVLIATIDQEVYDAWNRGE